MSNTNLVDIKTLATSLGTSIEDALDLAKKQYNLQRDAFNWNKASQTTAFNNAVNSAYDTYDRKNRARYSQEGLSGSALDSAVSNARSNLQLDKI